MPRSGRLSDPATITMFVACLGFGVVVLDTTVVNVALPDVDSDLDAGVNGLQWVVDAYTLAFAALVLIAGALSDRIGATRAFIGGMAVFVASSAICGLAPNLDLLIVARVVQGLAAAVMLPSSLALVSTAYPEPAAQRRAISIWTASGAAAITAGPVVGGALTDVLGWRAVFVVNVPIGLVALAFARSLIASRPRPASLDLLGQLCAVVSLGGLTFGVIEGGHEGFGQTHVIAALVAFGVTTVLFLWIESHVPDPLVPLHLFSAPPAAAAIGVALLLFLAFYGQVFTLSLFFQDVLRHGPAEAGLLFLPMTVLTTVSTLSAGRMVARFGAWVPMALGIELLATGLLALVAVDGDSATWEISLALAPMGLGMGFAGPPIPMALMAALPAERAGIASGVYNAVRQTGATLGVAIFGALVGARTSFVDGMHEALLLGVGGLAACLVVVVLFIRPRAPVPAAA